MRVGHGILAGVVMMVLGVSGAALADLPAIQSVGTTEGVTVSNGFTAGWTFTVTEPLTVVSLGVFDGTRNDTLEGWTAPWAGLWDSGGTLLASVAIPLDTVVKDHFFYASIGTPVLLATGETYTVGVQCPKHYDAEIFFMDCPATFDPRVTWGAARVTEIISPLTRPTDPSPIAFDKGCFGASFEFVPEPATLALLTLGGLAIIRRRRKR